MNATPVVAPRRINPAVRAALDIWLDLIVEEWVRLHNCKVPDPMIAQDQAPENSASIRQLICST